ncbi:putative ATP-dependent RNA helicase DHX57 [Blattella germanica]|nr:putative ATP-dependent RNA helicase DHX57 [Blattella germanica]
MSFLVVTGSQYPFEPALVYLTTPSNKFPPEARLRLTNRLLEEARVCASNETPAVYTIAQLLIDFHDEIGHLLKGKFVSFLDPHSPLFPNASQPVEILEEEIQVIGQPPSQRHEKIHRPQLSPLELSREDGNIVRRFKEKQSDSHYKKAVENRQLLPAWDSKDFILDAVKHNQVTVISGETGCGKSTQVPQFLLDDWLRNWELDDKKHVEIICTQPRRLSAIGVAERVAEERSEKIGNTVGYQFMCYSDFLLLILRDLLPERPDLKVILMSATLNAHLFCNYFKQAPTIEIPGRTFPVDQFYLEDIMDKTNYALEENSSFARKVKKSSILDPDDINSLECELELADIQGSSNLIPNPATGDEHLTITQLYSRYRDYSKLTCKNLYLMDPEKINYDLVETVITWIVAGDHTFARTGSILVFLPGMAEISTLHDQLMDHPVLTPRGGKFVLVPLHSTLSNEEQAAVFNSSNENKDEKEIQEGKESQTAEHEHTENANEENPTKKLELTMKTKIETNQIDKKSDIQRKESDTTFK